MSELVVETTEGVTLHYEIANAGSRSAAGMIDAAILLVLWFSLLVFVAFASSIDPTGLSGFAFGVVAAGLFLGTVAYNAVLPLFLGGRTPGKALLGLRVTDVEGYPARPMQHVLRSLFWALEVAPLVGLPIGVVLIAATERRQRLGDVVAGTTVLRDRATAVAGEPYPRDRWSELPHHRLPLAPALGARFSGEDLSFLRSLFTRHDMDRSARDRLLRRTARHYARVLGVQLDVDLSVDQATELLRELYVFLRDTRHAGRSPEPGAA